ncbi:MAG TPA: DUF3306 domain-containing protein [Bradyrhizobium sp.]
MSRREDFLARWSRRKRETAASANGPKQSDCKARAQSGDAPISRKTTADPTGPAFDLAKLPSIESITAETDIRNFLAPFVPPELTRAALRRVWTTDLKIRDFVGLADYDWDFNAPGSMAGFGSLEPTDALRRQAADLIGRGAAEGNPRVSKITEAKPISSGSVPDRPDPRKPINDSLTSPQNNADSRGATQLRGATNATIDQREKPELPLIGRRRHGQALPK